MVYIGPWHDRAIAGVVGSIVAWFATPVCSPIVRVWIEWAYGQAGADVASITTESIPGVTGLLIGSIGIHLIVWLVDRVKNTLAMVKLPLKGPQKDG